MRPGLRVRGQKNRRCDSNVQMDQAALRLQQVRVLPKCAALVWCAIAARSQVVTQDPEMDSSSLSSEGLGKAAGKGARSAARGFTGEVAMALERAKRGRLFLEREDVIPLLER